MKVRLSESTPKKGGQNFYRFVPKRLPIIYACGIHAVDALVNTGCAISILAEKNSSNLASFA